MGLADAQADAEAISRLIKERISPYPNFILAPGREKGKDILVLSISSGHSTPYYYKADGVMEAYIRIGNESVIAPSYVLNQLLLKGMNHTFDALVSEYDFTDYAFSKLRERYKAWTGNSMEEKLFDSSTRRNPVLADIFGRLGYMERQGSGFRKITEAYHAAYNYRNEL